MNKKVMWIIMLLLMIQVVSATQIINQSSTNTNCGAGGAMGQSFFVNQSGFLEFRATQFDSLITTIVNISLYNTTGITENATGTNILETKSFISINPDIEFNVSFNTQLSAQNSYAVGMINASGGSMANSFYCNTSNPYKNGTALTGLGSNLNIVFPATSTDLRFAAIITDVPSNVTLPSIPELISQPSGPGSISVLTSAVAQSFFVRGQGNFTGTFYALSNTTINVSLYNAAGITENATPTTVLETFNFINITTGQAFTINFSTVLVANNSYAISFVSINGSQLSLAIDTTNPYKNGTISIAAAPLYNSWTVSTNNDLRFIIQIGQPNATITSITQNRTTVIEELLAQTMNITVTDNTDIANDTSAILTYRGQTIIPTRVFIDIFNTKFVASFITPTTNSTGTFAYQWLVNITDGFPTTFNSSQTITPIGGLITASSVVFATSNQQINLTVNRTSNITTNFAALRYDGLTINPSRLDLQNVTIFTAQFSTPPNISSIQNYTWIYNFTASDGKFTTHNITALQTIIDFNITNCIPRVAGDAVAINNTVRDEDTPLVVLPAVDGNIVTVRAYIEAWINDRSTFKTFNLTWTQTNPVGAPGPTPPQNTWCISPGNISVFIDAQAEYSSTGYASKTFYFNDAVLDNTTDFINFYLTAGAIALQLTVNDENDNPVPNVLIHVLRYDIGTNTYFTTEIVKTDSFGNAVTLVVPTTVFYKFILFLDNKKILEVDPSKILTTTKIFRVTLGEPDYFTTYNSLFNTACILRFTNSTGNFAFTFANNDGMASRGCLNVILRKPMGDTPFNQTCVSSTSGTLLTNILPTDPGGTYTAQGSIVVNGKNLACGEPISISFSQTHKIFGLDGIFLATLLFITLFMIGLWNPIVAVFLGGLALFFSIVLGIFSATWIAVTGVAIITGIFMYRLRQ